MKQETIVQQALVDAPRFVLRPLRNSDLGLITLYASDRRGAENPPRGDAAVPAKPDPP